MLTYILVGTLFPPKGCVHVFIFSRRNLTIAVWRIDSAVPVPDFIAYSEKRCPGFYNETSTIGP